MYSIPGWIVVVLHLMFGLGETVGWDKMGQRLVGFTPEQIETTRMLALNQGAYNAGIALVLAWTLATKRFDAAIALLAFIVAMGVVGAGSVRWTIFVIQAVPALIAIGALYARE